jgi:hypothetical protein
MFDARITLAHLSASSARNCPNPAGEPVNSAALRDRLLRERRALATWEEATVWAQKAMVAKNTLTAADSRVVEAAFPTPVAELVEAASDQASCPQSHSESQLPRVNRWRGTSTELPPVPAIAF